MSDAVVWNVDADTALESMDDLMILLGSSGMAAFLSGTVGPYLKERADDRFTNEGDDVVGQWKALSPATVEIREQQGFIGEGPINRRTGEMERWVTGSGWHSYPQAIGATLKFPSTTPSGKLKKKVLGAQRGEIGPPRPILGVNENDLLFVMSALSFAVDTAIR